MCGGIRSNSDCVGRERVRARHNRDIDINQNCKTEKAAIPPIADYSDPVITPLRPAIKAPSIGLSLAAPETVASSFPFNSCVGDVYQ